MTCDYCELIHHKYVLIIYIKAYSKRLLLAECND